MLKRSQKLKVNWMYVGDDPDIRLDHPHQRGDLPRATHPHLHNHRFCIGLDGKQGERDAHLVVLIRRRRYRAA